jgi:uncharacterized DUF497 family protein
VRILGFDWDETNRRKLELHDLDPDSVEELLADPGVLVLRHRSLTGRYLALGFVPDGRFVIVVFGQDRETRWVRVVTAYEPTNPRWCNEYERLKSHRG